MLMLLDFDKGGWHYTIKYIVGLYLLSFLFFFLHPLILFVLSIFSSYPKQALTWFYQPVDPQ
jgi:hypothetical protein